MLPSRSPRAGPWCSTCDFSPPRPSKHSKSSCVASLLLATEVFEIMPKATKALRIEKGTVSGNTPFTGLSAAPGPPDTLLRSEPTEAQMEEYRNALILEEQRRKERYSLTSKRWRREQTIWKYVNELAVLFESQVYVVIQHHGEDKKQVYHSAPTKKNWPASFADTVCCIPAGQSDALTCFSV